MVRYMYITYHVLSLEQPYYLRSLCNPYLILIFCIHLLSVLSYDLIYNKKSKGLGSFPDVTPYC